MIHDPFAGAACCYDVAATHADRRNLAKGVRGVRTATYVTVLHYW